jgi:serralysin
VAHQSRNQEISLSFGDHDLYVGSRSGDRFAGDAGEVLAFGRGGGDRLTAGDGEADLMGGDGNDRLTGGDAMDHLDGGRGNDRLVGGGDNDHLRGAKGNDRLDGGDGHDDVNGGMGDDRLTGGRGADAFVVTPDSGHDVIYDFVAGPGMGDHLALNGITPEELVFEDRGPSTRISWNGGAASVLLLGVELEDLAQDDFMFTADKQLIPVGRDLGEPQRLVRDRPDRASRDDGSALEIEASGRGFAFDEFVVRALTDGGDTETGGAARDFLLGLGGDDVLSGGAEADDLWGGDGDDVLIGGGGANHLKGGAGADRLEGGAMADNLMGGAGDDIIVAGAEHDMIEGGLGDDTLDGGDGADAFVVRPDSGNDVVVGGFTAGAGAFDHIAFIDILPGEVEVTDTGAGVLVSWGTGSILLQGLSKADMTQDDFMFSEVEGGAFLDDPEISAAGSALIFGTTGSGRTGDDLFG